MLVWLFVSIALIGLTWHFYLLGRLVKKSREVATAAKPLADQVAELSIELGRKPELAKQTLAIDRKMDEVLLERFNLMRKRQIRKAQRQRRLIDNLKKIDPTERRFSHVRKRS